MLCGSGPECCVSPTLCCDVITGTKGEVWFVTVNSAGDGGTRDELTFDNFTVDKPDPIGDVTKCCAPNDVLML